MMLKMEKAIFSKEIQVMGSLINFGFSLEPRHLRFLLNLRLLFLAMLESGAPLSSSLEEALYKCSVCMN